MFKIYTHTFYLSILFAGNLIAMDEDFIENRSVVGTQGRVSTGIYYRIRSDSHTVLDDGEERNLSLQPETSEGLRNPHRIWYLIPSEVSCQYRIKSGRGSILTSDEANQLYLSQDDNQHHRSPNWAILSTKTENKFIIRSAKNGVLGHEDNSRVTLTTIEDEEVQSEEFFGLWEFVPINFNLKATICDFYYDPQILDLTSLVKPSYTEWMHIQNTLGDLGPISSHVTGTVANQVSWEFDEGEVRTFLHTIPVQISAAIPPFNGQDYGTLKWSSEDVSLAGEKEFGLPATTIDKTLSVDLPSLKRIRGVTRWDNVDVQLPFSASVIISGSGPRMTEKSLVPTHASLDSDAIIALVHFSGFHGELVQNEKTVSFRINGTYHLKGALGVEAYTDISPLYPKGRNAMRAFKEHMKNKGKK